MSGERLMEKTNRFALAVIELTEHLPRARTASVIGRQLLRSGTSVGANYRAATRARSRADFISKMGIVEEETDESIYWMELLVESGVVSEEQIAEPLSEARQILAMTVASTRTARERG